MAITGEEHGQSVGPLGQPPSIELECPFNPYKNDSLPMSWLEIFKTILLLPVFLVRLVLWVTCLTIGFYSTKLALLGAKDLVTKPMSAWRRPLLFPVRFFARGLIFATGFQWITINGKPAPRDVAPIIVSNHVTFIDPVFIFFRHLPVIVTAKENLELPVVGSIMRAMQVISVDRFSPASRRNVSGEIKRRAMCNDWSHVMLFPEATTTNGRALVTFKSGAFTPGLAVQPMVVRYPHLQVDPSWVAEGPAIFKLLFRLMTQLHNYMEVEYLPIIEPTLAEQRNPRVFTERVRLTMAKALNVMVTDHGYEDAALAMEAVKKKLNSGFAMLEFTKFERLFHINSKHAKQFFRKYATFDITSRGTVTYEAFLKGMTLPDSPVLRQLFDVFDRTQRGYFDFKEYVLGLAFVLKHSKFDESCERAFDYCAKDKEGPLQLDELGSFLREMIPSVANEQILFLFNKFDTKKEGAVTRADFMTFLQSNPEYLALFVIFAPQLVTSGSSTDVRPKKLEFDLNGLSTPG